MSYTFSAAKPKIRNMLVECRSEHEYAERPIALTWEGQRRPISQILSRWRTPGGKHFRVRTAEGEIFELTYVEVADEWQIKPLQGG